MKKYLFLSMTCITALLTACGNKDEAKNEGVNSEEILTELPPGEGLNFEEIFTELPPNKLQDNVFKLFSEDYTVITAGDPLHYNSMTAGWGGLGILNHVPATYCVLRANRYTLELIRQNNTYTLSFFPDEYKEQVFFFGSKSGRDSQKMQETTLSAVQTPSGNMTYKEARLVFECRLEQITTLSPDDFNSKEYKELLEIGYAEANDYHKMVFGEITRIWVKK
jgi:flavin reductase (DIM6/NTAB) family NADH-FMN oxidoreductase RutF